MKVEDDSRCGASQAKLLVSAQALWSSCVAMASAHLMLHSAAVRYTQMNTPRAASQDSARCLLVVDALLNSLLIAITTRIASSTMRMPRPNTSALSTVQ